MKAQIEIGRMDADGGEQSLIKATLDVPEKGYSDLIGILYGFINVALKTEAIMNVFTLKPIGNDIVIIPPPDTKDFDITILVSRNGLQRGVSKWPAEQELSRNIRLRLQVKFE